jgi:hypothetical protein
MGLRNIVAVFAATLTVAALPAAAASSAANNAGLSKDDPNYVKCRKLDVTGSLVRKAHVCKTNAEWSRLAQKGSADADEIQTRNLQGSSTNGN